MSTTLRLILTGVFLSVLATGAWAQKTLTVSAQIPSATGLQLTVATYNASTGQPTGTASTTATTLPFGMLTFDSTSGTYRSNVYFSVAVGTTGGAGTPTVDVTYAEGTNPNDPGGSTNGLGTKATATFMTVNPTNNAETVSPIGKKRLIDLTGTAGQLTGIPPGSYEKVYVGLWIGSTANPADPSNGKPFTNADAPGTYTGTLTFTTVTA